jgi:hypothetical protein
MSIFSERDDYMLKHPEDEGLSAGTRNVRRFFGIEIGARLAYPQVFLE